ncbi:sensor histidine kinase [Methylobacterium oryzihabitans]|uniref:Blue-light-activated histidine kinase n=1 Tax=Methylobacterium oryzihabitans TaxID=2499852 RepID=A0A3S2YQR1_9HYPH|nr:PAS domain S-box protein [Methylobacterium oryzihabitans]
MSAESGRRSRGPRVRPKAAAPTDRPGAGRPPEDALRAAVEAAGLGLFEQDRGSGGLVLDARARLLMALTPDASADDAALLAGIHPEDRARVADALARARDPAGPGLLDVEYRTDGAERWLAARGRRLEDGRLAGAIEDVTARRRAEERSRLLSRATSDAIRDWDLAGGHVAWNEALGTAYGYRPDAVAPTAAWWIAQIHPGDRTRVEASLREAIEGGGEFWSDEYRFRRADGSYADVLDRGSVIRDARGRAARMIGVMLDISARKRAEERQQLLTGELQHRVKNTLALVQAIASQTLRNTTDIDSTREVFAARLISLGRAHDILTQSSWTAAPVADVVAGALGVHRDAGSPRIHVGGPDVLLGAKSALSLALVLHELATNAAKYGALSGEAGHVEVRWNVVEGEGQGAGQGPARFRLTWSEHDGPAVVPPARKGFGSRLIERSFAAETGGSVSLTYDRAGLRCRLEAPLGPVEDPPQ